MWAVIGLLGMAAVEPQTQTFEDIQLTLPVTLPSRTSNDPGVKLWSFSDSRQEIGVAVTDLSKLASRPTDADVLNRHERAKRVLQGFAGQFFKATDSTIAGRPIRFLTGSLLAAKSGQTLPLLYNSAAFTVGDQAYELTWVSTQTADYATAFRAIREVKVVQGGSEVQANLRPGTQGDYTILGAPFRYKIFAPVTLQAQPTVPTGASGRLYGTWTRGSLVLSTDLVAYSQTGLTEADYPRFLKDMGLSGWFGEEIPPPKKVDGIMIWDTGKPTPARHSRIELSFQDNRLGCLILSAPTEEPLPGREETSLSLIRPESSLSPSAS
ncbi:MAG: hypothetical protein MH204_01680 [Fimbriimonadaceae bacterium]|nr:hypothetical protein [Fimbriimonadaceae bacterium]